MTRYRYPFIVFYRPFVPSQPVPSVAAAVLSQTDSDTSKGTLRSERRSRRIPRPASRLATRATVVDGGKNGAPGVAFAAFVEEMDGRLDWDGAGGPTGLKCFARD